MQINQYNKQNLGSKYY